MPAMRVLADENQVAEQIEVLGGRIAEEMADSRPLAIVGIRSRGDILARRLGEVLKPDHIGTLDITLYRDDLSEIGAQPVVRTTDIPFDVDGANILLVDDVLMSGRSVRAALQLLVDFGRPRCVKLAVMVDRGGRELPIAADYIGQHIEVPVGQRVEVHLQPTDRHDQIVLIDQPGPSP